MTCRSSCLLPGEQELQHHEIGKQDIRGRFGDRFAGFVGLLTRIAGELYQTRRVSGEFAKLLLLRVRQRVHRIDDNGTRPTRSARRPLAQNLIDDGNEEAQRLARASAGCHHIADARGGSLDRLYLVLVEIERRSSLST